MPRRLRVSTGGYVYHVLNRAVGRRGCFSQRDYEAFEEVLTQAKARLPMRVLGWCAMPNHWHLVLWPRGDGDLSEFMRWLTVAGNPIDSQSAASDHLSHVERPGR